MDERDNGKEKQMWQPEFKSWIYTNSSYSVIDSHNAKGRYNAVK